jgi:hypothetical protein
MRFTAALALLTCAGLARAAEPVTLVSERDFPTARQPQAAVDPAGNVYVVFGSGNAIHCVTSRDGGRSYSSPVKVGEAGVMALGMRRGPRVAATDKAVVVAAICGEQGKGRDGDVVAWRSHDAGKTWHGPVRVTDVPGAAREGLHHLAAGPDGRLYCVWIDLRAKGSRVFGAGSADGGATWTGNRLLYESPAGRVCECCQPVVTFDPRGGLHVLWRNLLEGARDMYLISSPDGGRTFGEAVKLGQGTWPLNACPMDGGALAADADGRITTIWMRQKQVFRCVQGEPEELLGRGEQGWAALGKAGVYLAWIEGRPGALRLLKPGEDKPLSIADRASDPMLAGSPKGTGPVVLVWEEGPAKSPTRLRAVAVEHAKP